MVKLIFCLRRLPHLDRTAFQAYWRDVHAPLVAAHADALGLLRYEQSHTLDDSLAQPLAAPRGSPAPFDGVAELWWEPQATRTSAQREAARIANAALLADERRFIDLAASPLFLAESRVFVGNEALHAFVQSRAPG